MLIAFPFRLAPPTVILSDPSAVVRSFPGYKMLCSATGTPPIYTALIRNSTVLYNATKTRPIKFEKDGNYSCVATSKYGADEKEFSVIFIGKTLVVMLMDIMG